MSTSHKLAPMDGGETTHDNRERGGVLSDPKVSSRSQTHRVTIKPQSRLHSQKYTLPDPRQARFMRKKTEAAQAGTGTEKKKKKGEGKGIHLFLCFLFLKKQNKLEGALEIYPCIRYVLQNKSQGAHVTEIVKQTGRFAMFRQQHWAQ